MTLSEAEANAVESDQKVGVKELGHIVLYVRDIDASASFYRDVLGWQQLGPKGGLSGAPIAMFSGGRTHHELLLIEVGKDAAPIPAGRRVGMYHFGLKVGDTDEELAVMAERLRNAGVSLTGASDHGVTHSLYLRDPDGNEIELYIDVAGIDWSDFNSIAGAPKPLRLNVNR